MKKALISPLESISTGFRIADISAVSFDVAPPMFWVDVPDEFTLVGMFYNPATEQCESIDGFSTGPVLPIATTLSALATRFTFESGQILVEHDHADGGRHRTAVETGEYRVLRDGAETIVGAGAVIYFTATERHSIEALSPGSIVNTVIPGAVSRFQARAALYQAGYLETVESIMAMPETPMLAKLAWQDAQEFRRDSTTVATMASALSLTGDQVDDLFVAASQIVA